MSFGPPPTLSYLDGPVLLCAMQALAIDFLWHSQDLLVFYTYYLGLRGTLNFYTGVSLQSLQTTTASPYVMLGARLSGTTEKARSSTVGVVLWFKPFSFTTGAGDPP